MKLLLLSAVGLCAAMSTVAPALPAIELQLQKLTQLIEERAKFFNDFLGGWESGEGVATTAVERCTHLVGLQLGSLGTSSVQPSCGLHSGARGLTPESEWRQMFPHKPGYSR